MPGINPTYDRGHLVPANHLDHSRLAINQSNYMANIVPQPSSMNRGAWLETERLVECYRDIEPLRVVGGVLWGEDSRNDHFVASHGIATPEALWKLVIGERRAIAWVIPNSTEARAAKINDYLFSIDERERVAGIPIAVSLLIDTEVATAPWPIPVGCDSG